MPSDPPSTDELLRTALEALELIHDDDPGTRRALRALRDSEGYAAAFDEPEPLVSVVIPTWTNTDALIGRSLPSALGQTHRRIEVVVVGDAAPAETEHALTALHDERVRFHNLTIRAYHPDPRRSWLASGTPGLNAGVALARGRWIAPLGDDDAFVPEHVEQLLAHARAQRLEFVYGRLRQVLPDGSESLLGTFPPEHGQIGLQAAVYHAGLRFMELELGHALFGKPNDWGLIHRMIRVGVRIGMVDAVTVTYWPSGRHGQRAAEPEPARQLADARARAAALEAQVADLQRRLRDVLDSRSWRLTAPLRRARRSADRHP